MLNIPHKAFKVGAESKSDYPIKYGKSRVSGSKKIIYNLHSKGVCMPGCKDHFTTNSRSKPEMNEDLISNKVMSAFKTEKFYSYKYKVINRKNKYRIRNEYIEFNPYDDDTLLIAINALYRHIFGNMFVMDSERPIDIERRLRNGDITIKEFTRQIFQSSFYQLNYFDNISQYKSLSLRYKHILGRPLINQKEVIESYYFLNKFGYNKHIDWLIDSEEYNVNFGDDVVPYMRTWNSPIGHKANIFLKTSSITKAFATSDICKMI